MTSTIIQKVDTLDLSHCQSQTQMKKKKKMRWLVTLCCERNVCYRILQEFETSWLIMVKVPYEEG